MITKQILIIDDELVQAEALKKKIGEAFPDAEILAGLPSVDSGTLRAYYDKNVLPAPVVWIIVGDRKMLPMNEIARYGTIVELEKKDIYK